MFTHRLKYVEVDRHKYRQGQWYQDDNGVLWEFGYDIDYNVFRWFQFDPQYYRGKPEDEVEPPKDE